MQSLILPCEDEISDDDVLSEPEVRSELLLLRDAKCAWSPESFLARSSDWSRIRKLWPLCPPPPPGSLQVWSLTLFCYCNFLQSKIIETRSKFFSNTDCDIVTSLHNQGFLVVLDSVLGPQPSSAALSSLDIDSTFVSLALEQTWAILLGAVLELGDIGV